MLEILEPQLRLNLPHMGRFSIVYGPFRQLLTPALENVDLVNVDDLDRFLWRFAIDDAGLENVGIILVGALVDGIRLVIFAAVPKIVVGGILAQSWLWVVFEEGERLQDADAIWIHV